MSRIFGTGTRSTLLAATAIFAVGLGACGKKDADKPAAGGDKPAVAAGGDKPAPAGDKPAPAADKPAPAGNSAGALALIPKDTGMVIGISWAKFKETKYFDMLNAVIPADAKAKLDDMKASCGLDYLNDLDSITIASNSGFDKNKTVILVKGKWDEAKVTKCATSIKDKKVTVAKDGALTSFTVEGQPTPVYAAWASADTLVLTPSSMEGDKAFLTDLLAAKSSVKDNAAFMDLLGKADTSATIYMAFIPPADKADSISAQISEGGKEKLVGAYLSLRLKKDLDLDGGARFGSADDAKSMADKLGKQVESAKADPQVGAFLKDCTVAAAGSDVTLKIKLSETQLDQLVEMLKQVLPMLMMMGGGGGGAE